MNILVFRGTLIILRGDFNVLKMLEFNYGDICLLCASLVWAFYSIFLKFKPNSLNDFEFFATIVCIGFFWLCIVYAFMGYSIINDISLVQKHYWVFVYIILFPSILSYYFWHKSIKDLGVNKTGQFIHLMPLFGAFLVFLFLNERFELYHIVGAIFIACGIYLSLFFDKKQYKHKTQTQRSSCSEHFRANKSIYS